MSSLDLDETELERRLGRLESRYRTACLRLDLARLEPASRRGVSTTIIGARICDTCC